VRPGAPKFGGFAPAGTINNPLVPTQSVPEVASSPLGSASAASASNANRKGA
jgi:hypothetical protein